MWRDFSRAQKAAVVLGLVILGWVGIATAGHLLAPGSSGSGGGSPTLSVPTNCINLGILYDNCPGAGYNTGCTGTWTEFAGCVLEALAQAPGALWADVSNYVNSAIDTAVTNVENWVVNFVAWTVSTVLDAALTAITTVENWVLGIINTIESAVVSVFDAIAFFVANVASASGFFAPLVAAALFALFIVAGVVLLYLAVIVLFAFGKTAFNLL